MGREVYASSSAVQAWDISRDMVDLNRETIRGFDVREFYVELVSDLREKGF